MGYVYGLLLLLCIFVGLRSGKAEALIVTATMVMGSLTTGVLLFINAYRWQNFNLAILLTDLAMLAVFAWVAFRSQQRWPMLVCALQFIGMASHIAGLIADTPTTRIIGVAQGLWAYIQCFAIIFGVVHNSKQTISDPKSTPTN